MALDANTEQTVNTYLKQSGFGDFTWQGEALTLAFEERGFLQIELADRGLLLARLKDVHEYELETLIPLSLRLVHYDKQLPVPVRMGLRGNSQIAFIATLSTEQLSIAGLSEALNVLDYLYQQISE